MRLRRFLISDPMARTNLVAFAWATRSPRSKWRLRGAVRALDSQRLTGATAYGQASRFEQHELTRGRELFVNDGIAPLIDLDQFRREFVAVPESVTQDWIHA